MTEKTYYSNRLSSTFIEKDIVVFPNPLKDVLFIVSHDELEFDHFEIYDLKGRMCLVSRESKTNLSFLAKGIYIIRLKDKKGSVLKTMRIVKE